MCKTTLCCKCFKVSQEIQEHHVQPIRFFTRKNNRNILFLCPSCHREIESIIPRWRKLTKREYLEIHQDWMLGKPVFVKEKENSYEEYSSNNSHCNGVGNRSAFNEVSAY